MRRITTFALALPLIAGVPVFADHHMADGKAKMETKESDKQHVMTMRASKVIGMDVHNNEGKDIGDIKDVVLDGNTQRISYAVVSYGGVLGIGDKLFAVPWGAFQHRMDAPGKLFLNVTEEQMKNAPGFDQKNWPNMADENLRKQLDTHYGASAQGAADRTGAALDRAGDKVADKARDARDAMRDDKETVRSETVKQEQVKGDSDLTKDGLLWTRRASQIIGADVKNPQNENLGDIEDLVLDGKSGKVHYAVLSFGGVLGIGDKLFAIPMNSLQTKADDKEFVLNTTKDQLKNAPGFNKDKWPDFADAQFRMSIDNHYNGRREAKTD